ncbi:hypothetical protein F5144DRAFT_392350 [Chaetomium tenue]|uniref:Uncharacterized protein n=1 Tax=Chaetomium tenue TaxID=1854479 RepID=A0ACB7NZR3_9PEZI|nr:hypothetical protein F5144DRAFT_392350 [Chaetomium globosum]
MADASSPCQIEATQDLYGIGIRTGIYCQWIATMVAGVALPEEMVAIQTNTICFQCAIPGALLLATLRASIAQPEVLIVVPLAFGGFSAAQAFGNGASLVEAGTARGASPLRALIMLQMFGFLVGYGLWFWWGGVDNVSPAACTYYAFVFGKVMITRLRVFGIAISIFGGFCFMIAEFVFLILPTLSCIRAGRRATAQYFTAPGFLSRDKETPRWQIWARIVVNVASVCYIIVMVEMTLAWNPTLEGANTLESVGQLVPLIIGVAGLLRISYSLLRKPIQADSSISQTHSSPPGIGLVDTAQQHPGVKSTLNN